MKKLSRKSTIIIAIVALVALVAGIVSAVIFSGKKEEGPITLTVYSELANYSGDQKGWSGQMLLEKFNVILNIIPSGEGVYETRMESGHLGDIVVWGGDGENYTRAVEAGFLYDWNTDDLLKEHGPYIYEHMQEALKKNQELTKTITGGASDTLYGFGHNVATDAENHESFFYTWDIRWDLYEQLGHPEVKNLGDMVNLLKDMKEICPEDENGNPTYAVSLWPDWDGDMVMYVKSLATAYYGYDEHGLGLYDPATGNYHPALEKDGPYIECLKFFNELYQNGLVDPNSMTQTYDNMSEKLQAGGVFWSIFNYSGSLGYNTDEHIAENKMMCSLTPTEASPIVYGMNPAGGNRIWSIGSTTEYPELCMEIINWLSTPEGVMTYNYGPKDLCWYYDEDGYTHFTEFGAKVNADRTVKMIDEYEGTGTFNDGCIQINNTTWTINAMNPNSNGETYNCELWKSEQKEPQCDTEADWREYTGCISVQDYMESGNYTVAPGTSFVLESKDNAFKTVWKGVTGVITQYSWKAIYAESDEEFEKIVDEMISEAEGYGYDECVKWSVEQANIRHEYEEAVKK